MLSNDYSESLIEKQKIRYNYCLTEKKFRKYFELATQAGNSTKAQLIILLESRLDSILYRLGFVKTILAARQLINHRHILVNGHSITVPSYICKKNDIIEAKKQMHTLIQINLNLAIGTTKSNKVEVEEPVWNLPSYLHLDVNNIQGKVLSPITAEKALKIDELTLLRYYSR